MYLENSAEIEILLLSLPVQIPASVNTAKMPFGLNQHHHHEHNNHTWIYFYDLLYDTRFHFPSL